MLERATNYYDDLFSRLCGDGVPLPVGKKKLTKERDSLFWSRNVVKDSWNAEAMVLALARYLGQKPITAEGLVTRVAHETPDALIRAVRYSGLILNKHSPRRTELERAAAESAALAELLSVHRQCVTFELSIGTK